MLGVASERVLDGFARSVVRTAGGSAKELLEALDDARLQPTEHVNPSWPLHDGLEWTQEGGPAVRSDVVRCSGRHSLTGILTGRVLRDAQTDVSPLTCAVPAEGSPAGRAGPGSIACGVTTSGPSCGIAQFSGGHGRLFAERHTTR